jgi:hypothetical protein
MIPSFVSKATPVTALFLLAAILALASCRGAAAPSLGPADDQAALLAGAWVSKARVVEGKEEPAVDRLVKIEFGEDKTFRYHFRGDAAQAWVLAGKGVYSYVPPSLTFYWDSGPVANLLVVSRDAARICVHHGRNLAPLHNQDPDEVFVKEPGGKGSAGGKS